MVDMHFPFKIPMAAACLMLAGCASFETLRESRFVAEDGAVVAVAYGRGKERATRFVAPNGAEMPYVSKQQVRVTLPDGDTFTAYRHMSLSGVLYKTADEEWEFYEEGMACIIARRAPDGDGYLLHYQGVLSISRAPSDANKKKPRIRASSTPQGFGRTTSGPRDGTGPRTAAQD